MATYYVSKTAGNDSNNGTTTSTPFATIEKAFNASEGQADTTVEIIDSSVYYPTGTNPLYVQYPFGNSHAVYKNFTIKSGTDQSTGLRYKPCISGKSTNESGSIVHNIAFQYQQGWTIDGLEIRDFGTQAASPKVKGLSSADATYGKPTLIIKDCIIHHIKKRGDGGTNDSGGSANGVIEFSSDCGDGDTNRVQRCAIFEFGLKGIAGGNKEDVEVENCLIFNYGGNNNATSNNEAILLGDGGGTFGSGSLAFNNIIADYQGDGNVKMVDMGATNKGAFKYNIVHNGFTDSGQTTVRCAQAKSNIFNNIVMETSALKPIADIIDAGSSEEFTEDCSGVETLTWNSSSTSAGYFDFNSSEDISALFNTNGIPAYGWTGASALGINQASGSTRAGGFPMTDLTEMPHMRSIIGHTGGRQRDSSAAECSPDIGCYEFYKEFSDNNEVMDLNIADDFTINDTNKDQLENQYKVKLNDKECVGNVLPPFSKGIKGPANLRTLGTGPDVSSPTPYMLRLGKKG